MRAVKLRDSAQQIAANDGSRTNSNSDSDNSSSGVVVAEKPRGSQRHLGAAAAANWPSAAGSVGPSSKNATIATVQFHPPSRHSNASSSGGSSSNSSSVTGHTTIIHSSTNTNTAYGATDRSNGAAPQDAHATPMYYTDADSPYLTGSSDPLAEAFAQDAPLTFTARDEPRVVGRFPLPFHDMLSTIDQQLQYRQRQGAHQLSVDALPPTLSLSLLPCGSSCSDGQPPISAFIRDRLPLAVGRVPGCKTQVDHPLAVAGTRSEEEVEEGATRNPATVARSGAASTTRQTEQRSLEAEQRRFQERVAEEVLDYLLCPGPPRPRGAAGQANDDNDDEREAHPHGVEEEQRYAVVESCLSGLREVPSDSVEYIAILRRLVEAGRDAQISAPSSSPQQPQSAVDATDDTDVDVPAYAQQLLVGRNALAEQHTAAALTSTKGWRALAGADPRAPVVSSTLRAALDALLPPRMLLCYIVNYETAMAVQQHRRAAQAQQAALRQVLDEHPDDRENQAALSEVTALLAQQYATAPVGVVLVVLERTSDVQTPREYLKGLEQTLNEVLARCHARCCGRPIQLSTSALNAQKPAAPSPSATASAALPPTRPVDAKGKSGKTHLKSRATSGAAAAAGSTAPATTIVAAPKNPVCTRTTRPPPARPTALSSSGGGSASVATTLNVLEINKERRLVHFDLLGEELLRQVTVDLPERGVLLRRLLNEAQLSLDARALLARERFRETQEHLLDGQDTREALAASRMQLEAEVAQLRSRLVSLQTRKAGLEAWVAERAARSAEDRQARLQFEQQLCDRLTTHTAATKAAQEAFRQSALA
jgi:hypothetical protein